VLQYGDIQRVGDDRSQRVDVRVLAATNRDLRQQVLAGEFRADLFHRLSVFPLHIPPLRERGEDIALLAGFFCEQSRVKMGLKQVGLSESARMLLAQYGWPGNIRELEHAIYRAIVLARAGYPQGELVLQPQHFQLAGQLDVVAHEPEIPPVETPFASLREATDAFQRGQVMEALARNGNNWAASARQLGVDVANLHRLAKRLGVKSPQGSTS
jgi:anaerobic nitric oxide reductase transcription regulator